MKLCGCGKTGSFPSKESAEAHITKLWGTASAVARMKIPTRSYPCPSGNGRWHITAKPLAQRINIRRSKKNSKGRR